MSRINEMSKMSSPPAQPSLPWRAASSVVMGVTAALSRGFLYGFNKTETVGLDRFIEVLDSRKNPEDRDRGLITVSNHLSILDDPLIWGVLPLRYAFSPINHRWTLGSADMCFFNKPLSTFFSLGQVMPTYRSRFSQHGGLFQPTMTQAIRLLSEQPFAMDDTPGLATDPAPKPSSTFKSRDLDDPFCSGALTYTTTGSDTVPAPSAYTSRRHSWVHIFPEGYIHQHPDVIMRYFRWGVSRLILESEPLPMIIPIWIDGTAAIMHEDRTFPRLLPRAGNTVKIAFGEQIDGEKVFGPLRAKWKRLVQMQKEALRRRGVSDDLAMGQLTEGLKYTPEAVAIRLEVTNLMRKEVMKVRQSLGYSEEDPKNSLVETWKWEGDKNEGKMNDGSSVKDI